MKYKIGIIKETKSEAEKRVALTPKDCEVILKKNDNIEIFLESSKNRCFDDEEYAKVGVKVVEEIFKCDCFVGIKEVEIDYLKNNGKYLFFSHTIKGQPYNMNLLKNCIQKNITLIDYELIKVENKRVIGFGKIAGYVGAYETLRGYLSIKYSTIKLPKKAKELDNLQDLKVSILKYKDLLPKLLITGKGAVGNGIKRLLDDIGYLEVSKEIFNSINENSLNYTVLDYKDYYVEINEKSSVLEKYIQNTPVIIFGHYYKDGDPMILENKILINNNVLCIGDISCDINRPIQSTIKATTIENPFYYYNYLKEKEVDNLDNDSILVMSVDNIPSIIPAESSKMFSEMFVENVLDSLLNGDEKNILKEATICQNMNLTDKFSYLQKSIS